MADNRATACRAWLAIPHEALVGTKEQHLRGVGECDGDVV
jgi:hypothetical protein